MDYSYSLKIAKDRVGVLIGPKGEIKKSLETATKCKIFVNSDDAEVKIIGEDPLKLYSLKNSISAIGRGFNPDIAQLLLKQDYMLELIHLKEFVNEKQLPRVKGRIIGTGGKSRRTIEELTDCNISVYGKTAAIVGRIDAVSLARQALELLLKGANHSTVFRMLEKRRNR